MLMFELSTRVEIRMHQTDSRGRSYRNMMHVTTMAVFWEPQLDVKSIARAILEQAISQPLPKLKSRAPQHGFCLLYSKASCIATEEHTY